MVHFSSIHPYTTIILIDNISPTYLYIINDINTNFLFDGVKSRYHKLALIVAGYVDLINYGSP